MAMIESRALAPAGVSLGTDFHAARNRHGLLSPAGTTDYNASVTLPDTTTRHGQLAKDPMSAVSILLNILWILFGGVWMAAGWVIAAVIMAITIIGLPWAKAAFNIAIYTLLPFGQRAVNRELLTGQTDVGTGPFGLIGNLIWLVLAGWWLALGHLLTAIALAITIVGLPFAWAHFKLAGIALWPIGKEIVPA
jgi:uncharacterized membrane protein YccF (DUF307 family)